MSKKTEKENIAKIKGMIEQIQELDEQKAELHEEIIKLLRKRYPSSDRRNIRMFKLRLETGIRGHGSLDEVKSQLLDDIIWSGRYSTWF